MLSLGLAWLTGVCLAFLALPPPPDPELMATLLALGALCAWRMRALLLGLALLGAAVSLWLADSRLQQRMPDAAGRVDRIVTGVIDEFPRISGRACRFRFRVTGMEDSGPPLKRVQLSWYDCHTPPEAGETWRLKVRLRAPRGLHNPGGFDFERCSPGTRTATPGGLRSRPAPAVFAHGPAGQA